MDSNEFGGNIKSGSPPQKVQEITLQKAVDLGEYKPEYLSTFSEWNTLSKHVQFQFINSGLENRKRQLMSQYAKINNVLDFRLKPELKETLNNIMKQLKILDNDYEKLSMEYFKL
jgi:hypothetical protein